MKLIKKLLQGTLNLKGSLGITRRREFYKTNKLMYTVNVSIIVLSTLLGLCLSGPFVGFICFIIGFLAYIFVPPSITKISEIEHWEKK